MNEFSIPDQITIHAPIERCFLLSTRIELVQQTLAMTPIKGVMKGHVVNDSRVVWRGWKFGLPTQHHTRITGYEPPHAARSKGYLHAQFADQLVAWFQDSQERGRFASFAHDHYLREIVSEYGEPATVLEDEVRFSLPLGFPGRMVAQRIVAPHVRKLLRARFTLLKRIAEGGDWQRYIAPER